MKAHAMVVVACLACTTVQGAPFADPTQPPGATPDSRDPGKGATEGPRLQSVLISPNRRIAVISGQTVPLGGMYGESKVVRIAEGEVVLQAGQERQTLKLFSEVEKRTSGPTGRAGSGQKGARK